MNLSSELLDSIDSRMVPNKSQVLRVRQLTSELAATINNPSRRDRARQSLNDAYLNLQLATIADDENLKQQCLGDYVALIKEIERERDRQDGS